MSNTVPTPITDKNGKLTTVHKKADTTSASSARLAGLNGETKTTEKRTVFKPGSGATPDWVSAGHKVELGAKQEGGGQNIYMDGKIIGKVSSSDEMQSVNIKGTRLRRDTGYKKTWRSNGSNSEEKLPHMRSYGGSSSRTNAVNTHADAVVRFRNNVRESERFLDNEGIAFGRGEDFEFGARGHKIDLPKGFRPMVANWHETASNGRLSTSVEIRSERREYVFVEPNDVNVNGKPLERGRRLVVQVGGDNEFQTIDIPEDGIIGIEAINIPPLIERAQEFREEVRSLVKQIMDTRDKPNKMDVVPR
jgi:hypothetical protein